MKHIISHRDFNSDFIEKFIRLCKTFELPQTLFLSPNRILATLFFEPSTRTRLSFESAMIKIGGQHIGFADSSTSSTQKGESIYDTIRTVESYADAIVIRHPVEGSARLAAMASDESLQVPIINGGNGSSSHPTQNLLDLYTIHKRFGRLSSLNIGYIGDMRYGRTAHSLAHCMSLFPKNNHFFIAADPTLQRDCDPSHPEYVLVDDISEVIADLDILYVTRLQKERFPDPQEFDRILKRYQITKDVIKPAKKSLAIMHPLPRNSEIDTEIDRLPQAAYFDQTRNGVTVRKCLLYYLIEKREIP